MIGILHAIRAQIEMYNGDHLGKVPLLATFVEQMTKPTDVDGNTTGKIRVYVRIFCRIVGLPPIPSTGLNSGGGIPRSPSTSPPNTCRPTFRNCLISAIL